MKNKIIIGLIIIVLLGLGIGTYVYLTKEDKQTSLNVIEKKWVDDNKKQVIDISVFNNVPVLNYHGEGIIFDYLDSLETATGLEFNKVSYDIGNNIKTDYSFKITDTVADNDILLYQDNYVLVTLNNKKYNSPKEIKGTTVGVLNGTLDAVNKYLNGSDVAYKTYDDATKMIENIENGSDELGAIVVPRLQYLESVLTYTDLTIGYNLTEYKTNYVLTLSTDNSKNTLNSIMTKYYKKWSSSNYTTLFNKYLVNDYFTFNGEASQNVAKLRSKRYVYGFVNNKPFDVLSDGELVGINNSIIANYSKVSGVTVEYKQYKNEEELINAFNANEIDFYLANNATTEYKMDVFNTISPFEENINILTKDSDVVVNSVNSLENETVGVVKNSKISEYLKSNNINTKEYDNLDKLVNSKNKIIAMDSYNYQYYVKKGLKNYILAFENNIGSEYTYAIRDINENKQFESFLSFYLSFVSVKEIINNGLVDSLNISTTIVLLKDLAIFVGLLFIVCLVVLIVRKIRKGRNSLSKGDKLKYIDMLTSLKNRNYLNDNIELWDNSEVYPQTIIVVDLNDIAYINDNYGHAEGDTVIKEAANILIKNQLANSEIIRTNGNEFLIYLVSYDEKQVVSYMKKLNKEFKELAHGFGAALGYSVINDAIKTIDDAINEATIDMRSNKEESNN